MFFVVELECVEFIGNIHGPMYFHNLQPLYSEKSKTCLELYNPNKGKILYLNLSCVMFHWLTGWLHIFHTYSHHFPPLVLTSPRMLP